MSVGDSVASLECASNQDVRPGGPLMLLAHNVEASWADKYSNPIRDGRKLLAAGAVNVISVTTLAAALYAALELGRAPAILLALAAMAVFFLSLWRGMGALGHRDVVRLTE